MGLLEIFAEFFKSLWAWLTGGHKPFKLPANLENSSIFIDLDKIIAEPVAFLWEGKIHYLKPLSTAEFLKTDAALTQLEALRISKNPITSEQLIQAYADLFGSMCDTIGKKEVMRMEQTQIRALFQLALDKITGKTTEKKTQLKTQVPLPA